MHHIVLDCRDYSINTCYIHSGTRYRITTDSWTIKLSNQDRLGHWLYYWIASDFWTIWTSGLSNPHKFLDWELHLTTSLLENHDNRITTHLWTINLQSNHHQVLDCWTIEQSLLLDNLDYKINTDALSIKTIESPQNYVHLLLSNRHGFLDS